MRAAGTAAGLACLLLAGVAAAGPRKAPAEAPPPRMPVDAAWQLRAPAAPVEFHGVVSFDQAGGAQGGMAYPAPDPITFLASILVHGAVSSGMKDAEKNRLRQEADKVLQPYAPVLATLTHEGLMQQALSLSAAGTRGRLLAATDATGEQWLLDSQPSLSMTQDQRALVLDNVVTLTAPGGKKPAHANSVRVVSAPLDAADPHARWTADGGAELKRQAASLIAESLDMFLGDTAEVAAAAPSPARTVRYPEGTAEKMERAQVLADRCGRLRLKTLRGWLMSVPAAAPAADCAVPGSPVEAAKPAAAPTTVGSTGT